MQGTKFYLYYNYPYCAVIDIDDTDCLGVGNDGNIYIGAIDSDVYGTNKACEGFSEERINSEEDIDKYFKDVEEICSVDTNKTVSKNEFIEMIKDRYKELVTELENECDLERDF